VTEALLSLLGGQGSTNEDTFPLRKVVISILTCDFELRSAFCSLTDPEITPSEFHQKILDLDILPSLPKGIHEIDCAITRRIKSTFFEKVENKCPPDCVNCLAHAQWVYLYEPFNQERPFNLRHFSNCSEDCAEKGALLDSPSIVSPIPLSMEDLKTVLSNILSTFISPTFLRPPTDHVTTPPQSPRLYFQDQQ
jgi:hypothetical protein